MTVTDTTPSAPAQSVDALREALEWYAEQVDGCRKLSSAGDPFRQALDRDGGKRARAALAAPPRDDAAVDLDVLIGAWIKRRVQAGQRIDDGATVVAAFEAGYATSLTVAPPAEGWRTVGDASSTLIYSLRQDGWTRGKPCLVNDVTIRVEPAYGSTTQIQPIVDAILRALPAAPHPGALS